MRNVCCFRPTVSPQVTSPPKPVFRCLQHASNLDVGSSFHHALHGVVGPPKYPQDLFCVILEA